MNLLHFVWAIIDLILIIGDGLSINKSPMYSLWWDLGWIFGFLLILAFSYHVYRASEE